MAQMFTTASSSSSAPSSSLSAAQTFFIVVELVEHVLLDGAITVDQPFVLQRVDQTFRGTIKGSLRLRRKMGLAMPATIDTDEDVKYNGLSQLELQPRFFPRQSRRIVNNDIRKAFGSCKIDYTEQDGVTRLLSSDEDRGRLDTPRLMQATGSWVGIHLANVPLFARLHYYSETVHVVGLIGPRLKKVVKFHDDVQTLGDVHRMMGLLKHEYDYLEVEPAGTGSHRR